MERVLKRIDLPTVLTVLGLCTFGIVSIASSTMDASGGGLWRNQVVWIVVASVAATVVVAIDYRVWASIAILLHSIVVVLLTLTVFFGREIGGNKSWLVLGPARLQPSELAKWTTCLIVAVFLSQRVRESMGLSQMIQLGVLVGIPFGLIAIQPDHGTALTFIPIYIAGLLIGGVRWKVMVALLLSGLFLAPVVWTQLKPYQKARVLQVFDSDRDPTGVGYQIRQSKIAIGSGGVLGKGPFRGTQSQLNFLPAQHTDFIIAVIAEELGFLGVGTVMGLIYFLLFRGLMIAQAAQDRLGTYLCVLIVAWMAGQVTINVGMVLGRLPTIGVPLPLLSYGGSSMIASMCSIALIINVRVRRFVN